jgi:hypothetical protein
VAVVVTEVAALILGGWGLSRMCSLRQWQTSYSVTTLGACSVLLQFIFN